MSKWPLFSFEEVILDDTKNGTKIKKEDYLEQGIYPVIDQGQNAIAGYINIAEGLYNNIPAIIFGDHTRVIKHIDTPFFLGADGVKLLKSKMQNASYKYLYYFFVKNEVQNTGYNRHFKWLKELVIPIPPLEAQKQIAQTLDTAAELLAMRKLQFAELDNLIKSTFYDMFGDLASNEKGWEVEKLGSAVKESPQNGLYKPSSAYTNGNLGTPILRIDSFYDGELKQPLALKRLNCTQKEIDLYSLSENDVVINRVNSIEYLGKCAHITGLLEKTVFESNMMRLQIRNTVNSKYLTIFLCTPYIYNQILSHAKKAVNQASINQKDVQDFDILIPPLSLQTQFAEIVTKIEEQKTLVKKAIDETQYLFDSLMSEYFE